jgi:predicted transcriptional regulator
MPLGNITTIDRFNRLEAIKKLMLDGKTEKQIADELGINVRTVKRNIKYLEELSVADVTPEQRASKRADLYIELLEAAGEARDMFERYKEKDNPMSAKTFFTSWMSTIELRMKLYGLDQKVENLSQINNFNFEPDKVDWKVAERIAKVVKENHEKKD